MCNDPGYLAPVISSGINPTCLERRADPTSTKLRKDSTVEIRLDTEPDLFFFFFFFPRSDPILKGQYQTLPTNYVLIY